MFPDVFVAMIAKRAHPLQIVDLQPTSHLHPKTDSRLLSEGPLIGNSGTVQYGTFVCSF